MDDFVLFAIDFFLSFSSLVVFQDFIAISPSYLPERIIKLASSGIAPGSLQATYIAKI